MKIHFPLTLAAASSLFLVACGEKRPETAAAAAPPAVAAPTTNAHALPKALAERLQGKWLRSDSDYVLEIKTVEGSGKMEAAYFNPRPIKVSKAEAKMDGYTLKVFVELRDEGYPGCTYTMAYDQQADQLFGVYYQAALQQSFDVVFARVK